MNLDDYMRIISQAINAEAEAFAFYNSVSKKNKDRFMKKLFKELAKEETTHKRLLESFLKKGPGKMHFSESKDYKVGDALPTPVLTLDLNPADGILIAIKKELEAMQMYKQLADASTDSEQKKLFKELVTMERGHKSKLEDIYTSMAYPEVW
jgi:rubrerythrin